MSSAETSITESKVVKYNLFTLAEAPLEFSHLLFADDMLIFSNGRKSSISQLMSLLREYEMASGQLVNLYKSGFLCSHKLQICRKLLIHRWTGFIQTSPPIKYLGLPLFKGRAKSSFFMELEAKIKKRLAGWQAKLLSAGGKITLINSVLSSLPIYTLAVLPVPKATLRRIQSTFSNFLWGNNGAKRHHWVKWEDISHPIKEGGLGVRNLSDVEDAMQSKLAWSFIQGKSL